MTVKIRFLAFLKKFQPEDDGTGYWQAPCDGKTIGEVLAVTNLSECPITYFILVNGSRKSNEYIPVEGDIVTLMPMAAGG